MKKNQLSHLQKSLRVGLGVSAVSALVQPITVIAADRPLLRDRATALFNTAAEQTGIQKTDVYSVTGLVIQVVFLLAGLIFFILMVYSGFIWMTARGNEESVSKAKHTMTAAITGLIVVVAAYAISTFVGSFVTSY